MTQPIDPTTWPKVEGPCVTEGDYWWFHTKQNRWIVTPVKPGYEPEGFIYGPIEFATNDAPETVTLYEVSCEDFEGKQWALKDADGCFCTLDGFCFGEDDATEHRSQTYVKQAATAG